MKNSHPIKSGIITMVISALVFGMMRFIPIKNQNAAPQTPSEKPKEMNTDSLLAIQDSIPPKSVEQVDVVIPPVTPTEVKKENTIKEVSAVQKPSDSSAMKKTVESTPEKDNKKNKLEKADEAKKQNELKKLAEEKKKAEEKAKTESIKKVGKIGVDRKLVSGVPGTQNYKGKLPSLKTKGSITIAYTVDKNGTVTSARRVGGISDKTAINQAISLVKKHVRANKGTSEATGTYQINF